MLYEVITDEEYQALRADIDQIKELFKNPLNDNFISGIHNYCDGRCQKCGFTDRCSSYVINKELDLLDGADKKSSEQKIMGLMMATSEIVQEEMQKRGIELDAAIEDISEQHYLPKSKQFVQLYAESYAQKLKHWLESNQMEIESRLIVEDRGVFNECIETITWFHLFIPAKINRALSIISCEEVDEFEQYDSNGSAKAALVAIDETIKAWQGVLFVLNHKEDTILKLLTHLSKLQEEVKNVFPEAEGFKRPGLDD